MQRLIRREIEDDESVPGTSEDPQPFFIKPLSHNTTTTTIYGVHYGAIIHHLEFTMNCTKYSLLNSLTGSEMRANGRKWHPRVDGVLGRGVVPAAPAGGTALP